MTPYSSYLLLKQHLLHHQRLAKSKLHQMSAGSETDGKIKMVETRLYIGLNDAETRTQLFETELYMEQLKKICFTYHVPFSVGLEEGGYFHEDGEYIEEKSLVLTLIDAEKATIENIAKDLRTLFHQESILITDDEVKGSYIT